MWGAIFGDVVGSAYEFDNIRSKDFELFHPLSKVTDDTVCTVAVAQALMDVEPFSVALRRWCGLYQGAGYGHLFRSWLEDSTKGPYGSWGNGSTMRTSACALFASSDREALAWARDQAKVTHDHPNGVHGAMALTHAIRLALRGVSKLELKKRMEQQWGYDLSTTVLGLQRELDGRFDVSAGGCVRIALVCVLEADGFEDAIRNCVSLGGDCDTTAAMAGPVAEALWGIPAGLLSQLRERVPEDMCLVMDRLYGSARAVASLGGDLGDTFDEIVWNEEERRVLTADSKWLKLMSRQKVDQRDLKVLGGHPQDAKGAPVLEMDAPGWFSKVMSSWLGGRS